MGNCPQGGDEKLTNTDAHRWTQMDYGFAVKLLPNFYFQGSQSRENPQRVHENIHLPTPLHPNHPHTHFQPNNPSHQNIRS